MKSCFGMIVQTLRVRRFGSLRKKASGERTDFFPGIHAVSVFKIALSTNCPNVSIHKYFLYRELLFSTMEMNIFDFDLDKTSIKKRRIVAVRMKSFECLRIDQR